MTYAPLTRCSNKVLHAVVHEIFKNNQKLNESESIPITTQTQNKPITILPSYHNPRIKYIFPFIIIPSNIHKLKHKHKHLPLRFHYIGNKKATRERERERKHRKRSFG